MNLSDVYQLLDELRTFDHTTGKKFNPFFFLLDAFSRIIGQSVYVIDFKKRNFVYVSPNPLFLCGHTVSEVMDMGYSYFRKVVVEDDLKMLLEIDQKGYELFCQLPLVSRIKSTLSLDFRLNMPDSKPVMVNQKSTPILLTEQGDVRFALCTVSLSTQDLPGNVIIKVDNFLHNYIYSFEGKKWKKEKNIRLTRREKDVLQLSARGYSNEEIAGLLFINSGTVKFHKTNIYSKLNVKNINEAITFAHNNNLLF